MKRTSFLVAAFLFLSFPLAAQVLVKLKVHVVLIDKDLNQKPVPKFVLTLRRPGEAAPAEPLQLKTSLEGIATADVPPGRYHLSSPQPIEFQGKKYSWELDLTLAQPQETVELSNDNASIAEIALEASRAADDLTALYDRLRHSVVRVWAEAGSGTGFFADPPGLILTNQHVIERSEYIAIQFDEQRKVPARLLQADPEKDIAVLWANLSPFPQAVVAPLARAEAGQVPVREGEKVFVIGHPLSFEKVLTAGVVSRVEPDSIVTDVSVSPGNSGSPLFNSQGQIVGIATARVAGVSKMVRIEHALSVLEQARAKMAGAVLPEPRLLPVEPTDFFPAEPLKAALRAENFDTDRYYLEVGPFRVGLLTPIVSYYHAHEDDMKAERRQAKRAKRDPATVTPPQEALEDAQKRKPVLTVLVTPKVSVWRPRWKTDFHKMRLLCGGKEVEPIRPGRWPYNLVYPGGRVADTTYRGVYIYSNDAIPPTCGQVVLEVYSEKEPKQPHVLPVDALLVSRIWRDFEPYRKALEARQAAQKPEP